MSAYFANFYSLAKFGIIFWGIPTNLQKVFIMQKRALRIILQLGFRESCRGFFKSKKMLTVVGIYIFECIMYLKKHSNIFSEALTSHNHNTRKNNTSYNYPSHGLTKTEHSCFYSCIKLYNKLPSQLTNIHNLKDFKKKLFNYICDIEPYKLNDFL